jgi:hypothetical protein
MATPRLCRPIVGRTAQPLLAVDQARRVRPAGLDAHQPIALSPVTDAPAELS